MSNFNALQDSIVQIETLDEIENQINSFLQQDEIEPAATSTEVERQTRLRPFDTPRAAKQLDIPEGFNEEEAVLLQQLSAEYKQGEISLEELNEAATDLAGKVSARRVNEERGVGEVFGELGKIARPLKRGALEAGANLFGESGIRKNLKELVVFGSNEEEIAQGITGYIDSVIQKEREEQELHPRARKAQYTATSPEESRKQDILGKRGRIPNDLYTQMIQAREEGDEERYQELLPKAIESAQEAQERDLEDIVQANNRRLAFLEKAEDIELPVEMQRMQNAYSTEEFMDVWGQFPITAGLQVMAQSGTETGLIMGAYAVGSVATAALTRSKAAGSAVGTAAAASVGGNMEFNRVFVSEAIANGVDFSDEESIKKFAQNTELVEEIRQEAADRAKVAGAVAGGQTYLFTKYLGIPGMRGTAPGEAVNYVSQFIQSAALDTAQAYESQRISADSPEDIRAGPIGSAVAANVGATAGQTAAGRGIGITRDVIMELTGTDTQADGSPISDTIRDLQSLLEEGDTVQMDRTKASIQEILESAPEEVIEESLTPFVERLEQGETQLGSMQTIQDEINAIQGNFRGDETTATVPEGLEQQPIPEELQEMQAQHEQALKLVQDLVSEEKNQRTLADEQIDALMKESSALLEEVNDPAMKADIISSMEELQSLYKNTSDLETVQKEIFDASGEGVFTRQKLQGIQRSMDNLSTNRSMVVTLDDINESPVTVNLRTESTTATEAPPRPEVTELARTVSDRNIPLPKRLEAIQNAFDEGILSERFATRTVSPDLLAAIEQNDLGAMTEGIRLMRPQTLEELRNAIETGDATALSKLVGIDMSSIDKGKGISGAKSTPITVPQKIADSVKRMWARTTTPRGARGPAARTANYVMQGKETFLKTNKEELDRHLKRTADAFPDDLNQDTLNIIYDYMVSPNETTRAALNEADTNNRGWQAILDERTKYKNKLAGLLIEEGIAQGQFKESIVKNMGSWWHTDYAVFLGEDVMANLTDNVKRKFTGLLAQKLRDPIVNSRLEELSKRELVDLAYHYDVIDVPSVDDKGNLQRFINGKPIKEATKQDLVKALQEQKLLSDEALSTIMYQIVNRGQAAVKKFINSEGLTEEASAGRRQETIHKKRTLADLDDDMSLLLKEIYGQVKHPNDVFTRSVMAVLNEVANYRTAKDTIQFAIDIGAAQVGRQDAGFSIPIASDRGRSALQSSFEVRYKDDKGDTKRRMVSPKEVFVSREFADLMKEAFPDIDKGETTMWDKLIAWNSITKYSYVVANIPAIPRNMIGSIWYGTRNGYYFLGDPNSIKQSFSLLKDEVFSKRGETTPQVDMLVELNILRDNVREGVLNDYLNDFVTGIDTVSRAPSRGGRNVFRRMFRNAAQSYAKTMTELHRSVDEVTKVNGFFEERAFLADTLFPADRADALPISKILTNNKYMADVVTPSMLIEADITPTAENIRQANKQLRQINKTAADVTLSVNPTFSRVPPVFRELRKFPIFGAFPAFAQQSIATQINAARYLGTLSKASMTGQLGNVKLTDQGIAAVRKMATRKAIGMAVELGAQEIMRAGTGFALGSIYGNEDRDELMEWAKATGRIDSSNPVAASRQLGLFLEQNLATLVPDYLQDNMMSVVDFDRDSGNITWLDTSYMDPHGPQRGAVYALHKLFMTEAGDSVPIIQKIWRSTWQAASPILGIEPGLQNLLDDQNMSGSPLDSMPEKGWTLMTNIAQATIPPFIKKTNDLLREKKTGQLGPLFSGIKTYESNVYELFRSKAGFHNSVLNAHKNESVKDLFSLRGFFRDQAQGYEQLKKDYIEFRAREETFSRSLVQATQAMQELGMSDASIKEAVTKGIQTYSEDQSVLSNTMINDMLEGIPPKIPLGTGMAKRFVEEQKSSSDQQLTAARTEELYKIEEILLGIDSEYIIYGTIDGEEPF